MTKLWFAFLGAAVAWSLQLIIGYALLAHACYPSAEPLNLLGAYSARIAAGIVTAVTFVISVWSLALACRLVTTTNGRRIGFAEAAAVSDADGVPRYLATAGVLIGIVFTLLIIFNALALIIEPTCRFA